MQVTHISRISSQPEASATTSSTRLMALLSARMARIGFSFRDRQAPDR